MGRKGAASSAGALIHETSEQLAKAKKGLVSGQMGASHIDPVTGDRVYDDYNDAYNNSAIPSENNVNGNKRGFNGNEDNFLEKNGTITVQTVTPTASGGVTITKTNIDIQAVMKAILSVIR